MVITSTKINYKISVAGAAETEHCAPKALDLARAVGQAIARHGATLLTGATTGIPYWAAIGAKEKGGVSIGFSPAASETAHIKSYKLPTRYFDVVVYTGFEYAGRNLLLTRASDGVIIICGRMGTLNEFTIAFEDKKPIGVLINSGGNADMIKNIVRKSHRGPGKIIYDSNPSRLVERLIKLIAEERHKT